MNQVLVETKNMLAYALSLGRMMLCDLFEIIYYNKKYYTETEAC